jgi:methyltransferase
MFLFIISFLIAQRLAELALAKRNEKWLRENRAIEYGSSHYPWMVTLHTLFIISIFAEFYFRYRTFDLLAQIPYSGFLLIAWLVVLVLKTWVILSLGKFWNTRILKIPGSSLVRKGPYKFIRHPNYLLVVLEIAIIPMIFAFFYTAIIFSVLNFVMLMIRIRVEEGALRGS